MSPLPLADAEDPDLETEASGPVYDIWSGASAVPRSPETLQVADAVPVSIRPIGFPLLAGAVAEISLTAGGIPLRVEAEWESLRYIVGRADDRVDIDHCPADVLHLVVEAVLAPWLQAAEARIAARIEFSGIVRRTGRVGGRPAAALSIELLGTPVAVAIHAGPPVDRALARWAGERPLARLALQEIGTALSLRVGMTVLTLAEAATLTTGAGLLLDDAPAEPVVAAADHLVAWAVRDGSRVRLATELRRPIGAERRWLMTDEAMPETIETLTAQGRLSEMPVRVIAEAGRLTVPLSTIAEFKPGTLLDFGGTTDQVALFAGGVHFADGRIVTLDGRSLVRIERLALL